MKIFVLILTVSLFLTSCKKNNLDTATTPVSHAGLVKSINQKIHKIDSSGHFHTTIDSFLYDNQNRVSEYFRMNYDTIFVLDTNGIVISSHPSVLSDTYLLHYTGDNLLPDSMNVDGTAYALHFNSANQFINVTGLPSAPVTTYTYPAGLIVGLTDFQDNTYSVDSIAIDANENVTSVILGANYFLDNSNQHIYGRIVLSHYTYSNIANPIHTNKSAALVLFLATSFIQSSNIVTGLESVSYGPNFTIVSDEVTTFQNTVDANHLIHSSFCPGNGDLTTWSYY